ncbi:uncharacterized protein GGS25DRAFT_530529 [Hypoxylon fragiforme]|uniref:uncharacterized protein n=1 Tax=Hypoxylon fragiforme TaxID=63214 RepID=UPI0020C5B5DC|nr:uncharacterized protein GGS25DRAFT_530529 [Hypoxylon fragiforme]KAI2609378.1 hypothetical protein GGS25DRAFT_530529 [Hypoxylon fragiforme]
MSANDTPEQQNQNLLTRPFPEAVAYDLSAKDHTALIRVPPHSSWSSGLHWHDAHTEFLQVLRGRARVVVGGEEFVVGADAGGGGGVGIGVGIGGGDGDGGDVITVPRGVVHEWRRADEDGEGLVVREWTEPRDGGKEVFFRNLNALVLGSGGGGGGGVWGGMKLQVELWNLFWRADNYPVVWGSGIFGGVATRAVMGIAVVVGWVLGCKGVYL